MAAVLGLDSAGWLVVLAFASGVTIIGAVLGGWSGVAKLWGFVPFLVVSCLSPRTTPNEHCEYDYVGNEYCFEPPL
jgi:hypothetical protein